MDRKLINKIYAKIKKDPLKYQAYDDLFEELRNLEKDNFEEVHKENLKLRNLCAMRLRECKDVEIKGKFYNLYKKTLLFDAPHFLDAYLQYLEFDRAPKDKFYVPRRRTLKQVVDALQELVNDDLDELFINMPPRVGKSSIVLFFVSWIIGKNSELSNLYSAFSDIITKAFYNGLLEILNDPITYKWQDIFPNAKIVGTNAQDETLNIDRKKRYPSLTCRSLYGTLNGACDCNGFLISDDLIGGIEEAKNKDRLDTAWDKVDNNFIPRAKETAKILWVGTRWSISDPAGRRINLLENDPTFKDRRYKIISLPALDENDVSNFEYDYNVGFSTEYYKQRRASFEKNNDLASWMAQYMNTPIEREGSLFLPDDLRYYNGDLPSETPDRIFMAVDPAFGGGDFLSAPIIYQYGEDMYVHDVVFSNEAKDVTQPLLISKAIHHNVSAMLIEANKSIMPYKEGVDNELKAKGYRLNIQTKVASSNIAKNDRIFACAPDIRENMIFLDNGKRSKEYNQFMQNVLSFKMMGKNKHDDAPDSLAMAIEFAKHGSQKVQIFQRPF